MAFDEFLSGHIGTARGFLGRALFRWRDVANAARVPGYPMGNFFEALREQAVDNWDTWNRVMAGPATVPTITITGAPPPGGLAGRGGSVTVRQRLSGFNFRQTALADFGGANVIPIAGYAVVPDGHFDGTLQVNMLANAPAPGTYRGMVLGRLPADPDWQPIAWVVAVQP
jgi:hypothetical protein